MNNTLVINGYKYVLEASPPTEHEKHSKIKNTLAQETFADLIGEKIFIRTVTYHCVGEIQEVTKNNFFKLSSASWVPDSGRFSDAIGKGNLSEIEPVGVMWVNIDSVVDMFPWKHSLPTVQK